MLLDFCAFFPAYVRHSNAAKLILNILPILANFRMSVTATATGPVPYREV